MLKWCAGRGEVLRMKVLKESIPSVISEYDG